MEKMSAQKSRRESRKEARLAKNVQKHESWIEHQKSRKLRKAERSKTNSGDSRSKYVNRSEENSLDQNLENNKEDILFDTDIGKNKILENTYTGKKMEMEPELRESTGSKVSKIVKRSKVSKNISKTKFEEFVEMETKNADIWAQEDLEMERRLAKKLKVKDGKLRGMDDELNLLFEGIPTMTDFFDKATDDEVSTEGYEKGTSSKKRSKRKKLDEFSGNDTTADVIGGVSKSEDEKEEKERNIGANSQRKLRKKKKKRQEGITPGDTFNDEVAGDNLVGISEPEGTQFANGTLPQKRPKKRKKSQKEEGDDARDTTLDISKAPEAHEPEIAPQEPAIGAHAKASSVRYVAPHLRSLARKDTEENTQVRRRVRGLLNRLSEANVESVTAEMAVIFRDIYLM